MNDTNATATDNTAPGSDTTATATSADPNKAAVPQDAPTAVDPNAAKSQEDAAKTGDEAKPIEYVAPTLPEGMTVDADLLAAATPILAKHGASQEMLNDLSALLAAHMEKLGAGGAEAFDQAYIERQETELTGKDDKWLAACKADKEIGGKNAAAVSHQISAVVGKFATPEFKEAMNSERWGNHPEFVRLISRIATQGYTPAEYGETPSGAGGAPKLPRDILWANSPSAADRK